MARRIAKADKLGLGTTRPRDAAAARLFAHRQRLNMLRSSLLHDLWLVTLGITVGGAILVAVVRLAYSGPTDPVSAARCLATGRCTRAQEQTLRTVEADELRAVPMSAGIERANTAQASPGSNNSPQTSAASCVAAEGLKKIPQPLRDHLLLVARNPRVAVCAKAVETLAPLRDQLLGTYERARPTSLAEKFVNAATDYVNSCLTRDLLLDRGTLSVADEKMLRQHIGFILLRQNLSWEDSQPICHAVRLGRMIVTAQHCIPTNSEAYKTGGGYTPEIAFRFLDQPTSYALMLRKLGSKKGYTEDRSRDFAILEIIGSPELTEDIKPLVGKMELFGDFYNLTANVYLRIANGLHSGGVLDFKRATRIEHSTLCRPSYIAPNGLFLHACHTEAGISGAPLFQRQNDRLVFVGIHNGVTDAIEQPTLASCAAGLPNYGVAISPATLLDMHIR